jgi:hypothetical protein
LGSSAMVVCFFFMPLILRSTFGWFACIPIDAPVAAPYVAGAVGSFWLHDPDQLCYQGYHRAWACHCCCWCAGCCQLPSCGWPCAIGIA